MKGEDFYNHSNKFLCDMIYLIPFHGGEAFFPFNYPTEAKSLILSSSLCTLLSTSSRWQHGRKFSSFYSHVLLYIWADLHYGEQASGFVVTCYCTVKVSFAASTSCSNIPFPHIKLALPHRPCEDPSPSVPYPWSEDFSQISSACPLIPLHTLHHLSADSSAL